jgi:hypothetical protein
METWAFVKHILLKFSTHQIKQRCGHYDDFIVYEMFLCLENVNYFALRRYRKVQSFCVKIAVCWWMV